MTADEHRAIRGRLEDLKREESSDCVVHDPEHAFCGGTGSDCNAHDCYAEQIADLETLLAEVEWLRMHGAHECPACGFDHTYAPAANVTMSRAC